MRKLIDWYWDYGCKRTGRWIISPEWIDSVMKLVEKNENIKAFTDLAPEMQKATLAVWGQSQAGKSTLLSHYLDSPNGVDSALCWSENEKVVFSKNPIATPPNTVVLNPFHIGSDASGVATRFYRPFNDNVQDADFPAEISFASRKQIMLAMTMGYFGECQHSASVYDNIGKIQDLIMTFGDNNVACNPKREAFELLRDACDVCEIMSKEYSRFAVFKSDKKHLVRNEILSSRTIASDFDKAKRFVANLLWDVIPNDDKNKLLEVYDDICGLGEEFRNNYEKIGINRFLTSMALAAKLEDIDSIKNNPPSVYGRVENGSLKLGLNKIEGMTKIIEASNFGYFQALIKELKIPVKAIQSNVFIDFLKTCDFLDFPGITNKATDANAAVKIDLSTADSNELLAKLYKTGKTLSIIYSQVENLSIDAFCLLVNLNRDLTKPALLRNGIKAWVDSIGNGEWDCKERIPLQLYLNLSCFGDALLKYAVAATGDLNPWVNKVQEVPFANSSVCKIFFTNNKYGYFDVTQAYVGRAKEKITNDVFFKESFLSTQDSVDSLSALFSDTLGTDYMFRTIGREISCRKRKEIFMRQEKENREQLCARIDECLPATETVNSQSLCEAICRRLDAISDAQRGDIAVAKEIDMLLKDLLDVDSSEIESLPPRINKDTVNEFLDNQIGRWISSKCGKTNMLNVARLLLGDGNQRMDMNLFFRLVSNFNVENVNAFICSNFVNTGSPSQVARAKSLISMILNNLFLHGQIQCNSQASNEAPLFGAFKAHLHNIQGRFAENGNIRPMLDGDGELKVLKAHI